MFVVPSSGSMHSLIPPPYSDFTFLVLIDNQYIVMVPTLQNHFSGQFSPKLQLLNNIVCFHLKSFSKPTAYVIPALCDIAVPCSHYFVHGGWFTHDSQLLDGVELIRHIPCTIIQGRYDLVTPFKTAWELHKVYSW